MHICVHGPRDPTNVEWQRYLNASGELAARGEVRILVLSRGGSPTGEQRRALIGQIGKKTWPVALLTDNGVARMAIFAMRVFNPSMKASATTDLRGARDFLGLTTEECDRAAVIIQELEHDIAEAPASEADRGGA